MCFKTVAGVIVVTTLFGSGTTGEARELTSAQTGFHFLEEPLSSRALGMGSAGSALGYGGFTYYNPAAPFFTRTSYLSADYGRQSAADLGRSSLEAAWVGGQWFAGVNAVTFTVDGIQEATEQGIGSSFSWQESALSLTAGIIRGSTGVAVAVHGLQAKAGVIAGYGISASAGIAHRAFDDRLHLAAAGFHIGSTTPMVDSLHRLGEGSTLPLNGRIGAAWSDSVSGMAYRIAADAVYRYEDGKIMVPVGFEFSPLHFLSVRLGKRFGHDTELINFGFGVQVSSFSADLGCVVPRYQSDTDLKWLMGLTYSLVSPGKPRLNPPPETDNLSSPVLHPIPAPGTEEPDVVEELPSDEITPDPIDSTPDTTEDSPIDPEPEPDETGTAGDH